MHDVHPDPVPLPDNPDLEWLRKQAKRLLRELRESRPGARLADAQLALARRHGFPSWRALKAHVDTLAIDPLIASAIALAERSPLAVQAPALVYLARVVSRRSRDHAERLVDRGLSAAHSLQEPARRTVLREAAVVAATVSPERALALLPSIDGDWPPLFHMQLHRMLSNMFAHGHSAAAIAYLTTTTDLERYSFSAASAAMAHADEPAKVGILRAAIRAGQQWTPAVSRTRRGEDEFYRFVASFWRLLPVDEGREAMHGVVRMITGQPDRPTHSGFNGVQFTSTHAKRLFEIVGAIRHLDPELANALGREYAELGAALERYPLGLESTYAGAADPPVPPIPPSEPADFVMAGGRLMATADAVASEFSDWFDYARGLFTADVESHRGDEVPRTCWASAEEYRRVLFTAGRHEGRAAGRYLERIPDPHLRLFAQIELAAALAGLPRISGIIVGSRSEASHGSAGRSGTAATGTGRAEAVRAALAAASARRPSARKPDMPPSYDPAIEPSRSDAGEAPSGGSGPDFWVIRHAPLASVFAALFDVPVRRIELGPPLADTRWDLSLVLPEPVSRTALVHYMRTGIERRFGVVHEHRTVDVDVLTAPHGIRAPSFTGIAIVGNSRLRNPWTAGLADERSPGIMEALAPVIHASGERAQSARMPPVDPLVRLAEWTRPSGNGSMDLNRPLTLGGLCRLLESRLDRPLVDETGLTGAYLIDVRADAATPRALLSAVAERLGLVVTSARREVQMLVVHATV